MNTDGMDGKKRRSDPLFLFAPRGQADEKCGGVGGDGDGTEETDAADEGAHDFRCDHVEVHDVQERDVGLCGDEQDERERAADVGEDERIRHCAHDVAADIHAGGDERTEFGVGRECLHLVLGRGDGDSDIHDGAERAEHDAGEEELTKVHVLQIKYLEHAGLFLGDAREVGKVDGDHGENPGDQDAADGADDGARGFYAASVDEELRGKRNGGADEEGPEQDMRRREEDKADEPLCDEENGKEKDEKRFESCHPAEENEERSEADQEEEHCGQAVVVDDGVALPLGAHDDVFICLRMNVEGGIVHRLMRDRRLGSLRGAGVETNAHLILRAARRECGRAALELPDAQDLRLIGRRIAVLSAGQVKEDIAEGRDGEADGEEAGKALRMYFHEGAPFVACGNDQNYHIR